MKTFSKIVLYVIAVAVLAWFLPWIYALAFPAPSGEPFCSFSPVNGKWVVSRSVPGEKPVINVYNSNPVNGEQAFHEITRNERDSLVPQLFYKELLAHDKLPDSIAGKAVSAHELRTHELMLNTSPRDIVKRQPGVWLMMESMPERVDLTDADQVFRFTSDGAIEFVDMATNSINTSRSKRFTDTMKKRGFSFPARDLSANVTSRKQHDEGYLMIDNDGKLFHVKQQAGRPYVAAIKMPGGAEASKVFITEEMNRAILGFVTDADNNLYVIEHDGGYQVLPLPVGKVDPRKESILAMGNLFNTAFRFSGTGESRWRAVERTADGYRLLGTYDYNAPRTAAAKVADYIFPFTLTYVSNSDSLAYPRLGRWSWHAIYLNLLLTVILVATWRRRKDGWLYAGTLCTIVFGIYAFIPFILLKD